MATLSVMTVRSLVDLLDRNKIEQLAGKENFERGQALLAAENVKNFKEKNGAVFGTVKDEREYRVEFWVNDGDLDFICNCAAGAKGVFCAHCAATGLKWLDAKSKAKKKENKSKSRSIMDEIASYLDLEDKRAIISFLLNYAKTDDDLQRALWTAAASSGLLRVEENAFRRIIEKAVSPRVNSENESGAQYARKVKPVLSSLEQLFEAGRTAEVLALTEFALEELHANFAHLYRMEKHANEIACKLLDLHFRAAAVCRPSGLAEWIFRWKLKSLFERNDSLEQHERLLDAEGNAAYRKLVEAEWEKIPVRTHHDVYSHDSHRQRITAMMIDLARQAGDLELHVSILSRDLISSDAFFRIIELYNTAGHYEKALKWAQQGFLAFNYDHLGFRNIIANQHRLLKQHDEAMAILWKGYEGRWGIQDYVRLHEFASEQGQWPEWRAKALNALQEAIAKEDLSRSSRSQPYFWRIHVREQLIRIFAWEGDLEAAWNEIQKGRHSDTLMQELAARLEATHPERAATLYTTVLNNTINLSNNHAYRDAVDLLRKLETLAKITGKMAEFNTLVLTLRKQHYAKRNLIEMLNKAKMVK